MALRAARVAIEACIAEIVRQQIDRVAPALDLAVGAFDFGFGPAVPRKQGDHAGQDQETDRHCDEQFGQGETGAGTGRTRRARRVRRILE
jgi:hypothetical protein